MDIYLINEITSKIKNIIHETHTFILWHYIKGSIYDTPFWRAAQAETTAIFEQPNENIQNIVNLVKSTDYIDLGDKNLDPYGLWPSSSIKRWYEGYIK